MFKTVIKLTLASLLALALTGFFATNSFAANCSDEAGEWEQTHDNMESYCDCWLCLLCSSAAGKEDQARIIYENCMLGGTAA